MNAIVPSDATDEAVKRRVATSRVASTQRLGPLIGECLLLALAGLIIGWFTKWYSEFAWVLAQARTPELVADSELGHALRAYWFLGVLIIGVLGLISARLRWQKSLWGTVVLQLAYCLCLVWFLLCLVSAKGHENIVWSAGKTSGGSGAGPR